MVISASNVLLVKKEVVIKPPIKSNAILKYGFVMAFRYFGP